MGRGKIEIRRIENRTNRQVTFSKRRAGLIKKAKELSVLCDAHVSLIIISSSDKVFEYCSPLTSLKKMIDRYQQATGTSLWDSHYLFLQNEYKRLNDNSETLRKSIRQRYGEDLDGLSESELCGLEQNLSEALKKIRQTLETKITRQIQNCKKKVLQELDCSSEEMKESNNPFSDDFEMLLIFMKEDVDY